MTNGTPSHSELITLKLQRLNDPPHTWQQCPHAGPVPVETSTCGSRAVLWLGRGGQPDTSPCISLWVSVQGPYPTVK